MTGKKSKERKTNFFTGSGRIVERLYSPEKIDNNINNPGEYPYTRGVQANMYRGKLWTMRQYAGFGDAEESNNRYKYLFESGQTGLSVAFDLPTQIGYDSDNIRAKGEVGKVGVAIDTIDDMRILFKDLPLDKISTSMTINSSASILLAMYIVNAENNGMDRHKLLGTVQNDILKEYIARGTYIFPPKPSMKLVTDVFDFCSKEMQNWNSISVSGYHIREAGATASQEVGFTLADGIAYVEAAVNTGLNVDDFAPRISFFFNAHNDLLEEVAKFRAARRLWAKIMKERFNAKNPKSMMLRFHTQTAGSALTAQQPDDNIVRVTIQALASVLGGTQSLHTNSKDEALSLPTEQSVLLALRTQQIIAEESGVINTVDPLAGSYYVEALTDSIEKEAVEYIKKIDDMGGILKAIEFGYVQRQIQDSAYNYQKTIETKERIIVGVNEYISDNEYKVKANKPHHKVEEEQIKRLKKIKSNRSTVEVNAKLESMKLAAIQGDKNLMPFIIDAVRLHTSVGEVCDVLRSLYGEYKEKVII